MRAAGPSRGQPRAGLLGLAGHVPTRARTAQCRGDPIVARKEAGIAGRRPTQLHVFDAPARDERGWVLTVAHLDLVPYAELAAAAGDDVRLVPVDEAGPLPYDHPKILARAVDTVRARYLDRPDPDHLLSKTFTLRELQLVHEAVAGQRLLRDTFRRTMEGQLRATGRMAAGTRGRPARLFRQP